MKQIFSNLRKTENLHIYGLFRPLLPNTGANVQPPEAMWGSGKDTWTHGQESKGDHLLIRGQLLHLCTSAIHIKKFNSKVISILVYEMFFLILLFAVFIIYENLSEINKNLISLDSIRRQICAFFYW